MNTLFKNGLGYYGQHKTRKLKCCNSHPSHAKWKRYFCFCFPVYNIGWLKVPLPMSISTGYYTREGGSPPDVVLSISFLSKCSEALYGHWITPNSQNNQMISSS